MTSCFTRAATEGENKVETYEKKLLAEEIYELFEDYLMATLYFENITDPICIRDSIRSEDHDSIISDLIDIIDKKLNITENK